MSTPATMTPWKSPTHAHSHSLSHSHSHGRSTNSRPSTTPRTNPPMSPLLSPDTRRQPSSRTPRSPSPSYFGFVSPENSDPPDSNPGQHARQNWDHSSSRSSTADLTPRLIPIESNPEFESFRRKSEQHGFALNNTNLASFGRPAQSRQNSVAASKTYPTVDSPMSPRSVPKVTLRDGQGRDGPMQSHQENQETSFFDVVRHDSPASFSPNHTIVAANDSRLSLPTSKLQTPPMNTARQPRRAETLPLTFGTDNPAMITPQQFAALADSLPREILLLDLRVYPQYAASRLQGALNLCIPTTLLKRPSFTVQKLADTFKTEEDQAEFTRWKQCMYIVTYDANSTLMKDAAASIYVFKKFVSEGWTGQGLIIKGGFAGCSKGCPELMDSSSVSKGHALANQGLSIHSSSQAAAAVAGGCVMPESKSAANPFFGNIRQNMDLLDGVGQIPIKQPAGLSEAAQRALPRWLRDASDWKDEGKLVADRFLRIEKSEQKRMQQALSDMVSYGSPKIETPRHVRVAGIEKGSKNRYNNIFPYDHTRVRLQDVPAGGCDYVNANYVRAQYSSKRYIATQAPIPATFDDFWRVVWEQDVRVIVMLTAETEGGQIKCHPYWHAGSYGPLKLKILSERRVSLEPSKAHANSVASKRPPMAPRRSTNPAQSSQKSASTDSSSVSVDAPSVVVRHLSLSHSARPFQPMREITQLHYSYWPDLGAPTDPRHLLRLIEHANKYIRASSASPSALNVHQAVGESQRPVMVHCSAGCGRTGTFCTIDSVIDLLKRQKYERNEARNDGMQIDFEDNWVMRDDIDLVEKTVDDFRHQRLSLVQNLRQFVLCYETVMQWLVDEYDENPKVRMENVRRSSQS